MGCQWVLCRFRRQGWSSAGTEPLTKCSVGGSSAAWRARTSETEPNAEWIMAESDARTAAIYRMVMPEHLCPFGLKSVDLLKRKGYRIDDHWLKTRAEHDAFKAAHTVETTPQTFIGGKRIGGYEDLKRLDRKS